MYPVGGYSAKTDILEIGPSTILEDPMVVPDVNLEMKTTASIHFNNLIGVIHIKEEAEVPVVATRKHDAPASSDETHSESIHDGGYILTVEPTFE